MGLKILGRGNAYGTVNSESFIKKAVPISWVQSLDSWIRRRVRQLLWKEPENRYRELKLRWNKAPNVEQFAYSSNRYWNIVKSRQLHTGLSNNVLESEGWYSLERALRTVSGT